MYVREFSSPVLVPSLCIYATYDPETRSGMPGADRKIKGKTLHWLSCGHCLPAEVRMYERLWQVENPRDELARLQEDGLSNVEAMKQMMNPDSLNVLNNCYVEKFVQNMPALTYLQFQRIGYFNIDPDSTPGHLIFNKTVGLKDTFKKQ